MTSSNCNTAAKSRSGGYRGLILAVVWLLYASFGLSMRSMPPLVTPILNDLNMSYSEMGVVLGAWQLAYIPVAFFAGVAIDKFGIRRSLFVGALIMAISVGLRYLATGFFTLMPIVVLFGMGAPLISIGAPKTVSEWFSGGDRAVAVGVYTTAPWMGGLFAMAATNSLMMPLTGYSWRLVFLGYSVLVLIFALAWGIIARDRVKAENSEKPRIRDTFLRLLKVRNVRVLICAGLLVLFIDHGFTHWLPKILENSGMSAETAGFMASIPLLVALPCVLLFPRLVKKPVRGRAVGVMGILSGTAIMILVTAQAQALTLFGLVLYGLATPVLLPMLMLS
jgi:cyanate permease